MALGRTINLHVVSPSSLVARNEIKRFPLWEGRRRSPGAREIIQGVNLLGLHLANSLIFCLIFGAFQVDCPPCGPCAHVDWQVSEEYFSRDIFQQDGLELPLCPETNDRSPLRELEIRSPRTS
jgi:hypothetical protein